MKKIINFTLCLLAAPSVYALPFSITPKDGTQLPTTVGEGNTVYAYYTVANNATKAVSGNFVKYLPPNVTQVTNDNQYNDICTTNFNLSAKGEDGSHCTLKLAISGPVNGNDPDPHHHLFACLSNETSCAGTNHPLNVTISKMSSIQITPSTAEIAPGDKFQFSANERYEDGSTRDITALTAWKSSDNTISTIDSHGLATGIKAGKTDITATFSSTSPVTQSLTVDQVAYITNHTDNTITRCQVMSDHSLGSCATTGSSFKSPDSIIINQSNTYTYSTNEEDGNTVSVCKIESNRNLSNCINTGNGLNAPTGITMNKDNTYAFIANLNAGLSSCVVTESGSFTDCKSTGNLFSGPTDIKLNNDETKAYIVNFIDGTLTYCNVTNSGILEACKKSDKTFYTANGLAINAKGDKLYISNKVENIVTFCKINSDGSVDDCKATGSNFNVPFLITFNQDNTYAYIGNEGNNKIVYCQVEQDGSFSHCSLTGSMLNGPRTIVFSN